MSNPESTPPPPEDEKKAGSTPSGEAGQQQPNPEPQPNAQASEQMKGGSSGGIFLGVILLVVVLGYAYQQGMLDPTIDRFLGERIQGAASGEAKEPDSPDSAAEQPESAGTADALSSPEDLDGIITQLEAVQSRLIRLENVSTSLQTISEQLAQQIDRQSGDQADGEASASADDIGELEFEIIDLRLRLTGDSHAALRDLDALAERVGENSRLEPLISANRARLVGMPQRSQIISVYQQLDLALDTARAEAQQELAQLSSNQSVDAGFFSRVFSIRADDSEQREKLARIDAISAAIGPARTALLQGSGDYLLLLGHLREAADQLRVRFASVHSAQIAKLITELSDLGHPDSRLLLDSEGDSPSSG